MSNVGVHDFSIPHEHVRLTRDLISVRLPLPPKMVGSLEIPQIFRDMAQHNVMVGRITAMGPLAFTYKDGSGSIATQDAKIGDWVLFRPYAGTQTIGGKVTGVGNWRYLSSFQDALGIIDAANMPDPATLLWDDKETEKPAATPKVEFGNGPREKIKA